MVSASMPMVPKYSTRETLLPGVVACNSIIYLVHRRRRTDGYFRVKVSHWLRVLQKVRIIGVDRIFTGIALLHSKRDAEKGIFQNFKYIINDPIAFMLLAGKTSSIQEQKQGGRKVKKGRDNDPEFLCIEDVHDLGAGDLTI